LCFVRALHFSEYYCSFKQIKKTKKNKQKQTALLSNDGHYKRNFKAASLREKAFVL